MNLLHDNKNFNQSPSNESVFTAKQIHSMLRVYVALRSDRFLKPNTRQRATHMMKANRRKTAVSPPPEYWAIMPIYVCIVLTILLMARVELVTCVTTAEVRKNQWSLLRINMTSQLNMTSQFTPYMVFSAKCI